MVQSHHRRGWGLCTAALGNALWQKNPRIEASDACPTPIQAMFVDFKHHTGPQWPWYEATVVEARDLVQPLKAMVYDKNPCIEASFICPTSIQALFVISNTTLGPSGHGMKPPPSRVGTLYSHWRQWFMTKIHVLRPVSFVRREFKRCLSISNTTLGPSGHGMKPQLSMLGTLYSHWRQWLMTKIHVLRLVSFVRHQFKRCLSISNTTLGPSGHGMKQPSSKLGTLYSHWRQWFMTKIHVLRLVSFVQRQSKRWVLI